MEESKAKKTGGKREGQKYKSLLVWDILLKKTDENHALRLKDIEEHPRWRCIPPSGCAI